MRALRAYVIGGILLFACGGALQTAQAQQIFDSHAYVRQLHAKYIGREPSLEEESYWVTQLQSGASAADVHAGILASEAYFNRNQRNVASWINGAFTNVLNRQPTPEELSYWTRRYQEYNGDRQAWAKEFLQAASASLPPSASQLPSGVASDLPSRMTSTARLLVQAADAEIPGSPGYLLKVQTRNLETACTLGELALRSPQQDPVASQSAYQAIDAALQGVRDGLATSQASAPMSRLYVSQISDLLATIGRNINVAYRPPINNQLPGEVATGVDRAMYDALSAGLNALQGNARGTVFQMRSLLPREYNYTRLLQDAEDFSAQVDSMQSRLRLGANLAAVRTDLTFLQQAANNITEPIRRGNIDGRIVQSWYETTQALNRLQGIAGQGDNSGFASQLPAPPFGEASLSPAALGRIQSSAAAALAQCDVLIAAYTPYSFYSPDVKRLETELATLRQSVDVVRRDCGRGATRRQLDAEYTQCRRDFDRANSAWSQAVSGGQLRNAPDLTRLANSMDELGRTISDAR